MSALKTIIAFSLLLACSSRTSPKIAIYDNTLYGDITDGRPDKDTLSSTMIAPAGSPEKEKLR
jgi:hypothetical protein